jgi:hypothetical protein
MVRDYTMIMLIIIATAGVFISIMFLMSAIAPDVLVFPSEESCQRYNNAVVSIHSPPSLWCEHNETGWHFNATRFNEDWHNPNMTLT